MLKLINIKGKINMKEKYTIDLNEYLASKYDDPNAIIDFLTKSVESGIMTINEAREILGLVQSEAAFADSFFPKWVREKILVNVIFFSTQLFFDNKHNSFILVI